MAAVTPDASIISGSAITISSVPTLAILHQLLILFHHRYLLFLLWWCSSFFHLPLYFQPFSLFWWNFSNQSCTCSGCIDHFSSGTNISSALTLAGAGSTATCVSSLSSSGSVVDGGVPGFISNPGIFSLSACFERASCTTSVVAKAVAIIFDSGLTSNSGSIFAVPVFTVNSVCALSSGSISYLPLNL